MKTTTITRAAAPALLLVAWLLLPQTAHCFYNASTGRWMSRDPISELGCKNLYAFVGQDAIDRLDVLGLASKKCGVQSFTVEWSQYSSPFFELKIKIKFKTGGEFDPRCCEYKQNAASKFKITRTDGSVDQIDVPMHDDGYDRRRNEDGSNPDPDNWRNLVPDLSNPNFETSDHPGVGGMHDGWIVNYYEFTAEQIVYSPGKSYPGNPDKGISSCGCEKNKEVAKRGPHTATAKGTVPGPYQYTGVPVTLDKN